MAIGELGPWSWTTQNPGIRDLPTITHAPTGWTIVLCRGDMDVRVGARSKMEDDYNRYEDIVDWKYSTNMVKYIAYLAAGTVGRDLDLLVSMWLGMKTALDAEELL